MRRKRPRSTTWARKPGCVITSTTAFATAQASGLPPKVEPCVPAVMPDAACAVARQAPTGNPPPSPLAIVAMSGLTPACSQASSVPVRPMPAWISSRTSSRPCSSHRLAGRAGTARRQPDAALALDRLDQDGGGFRPDRRPHGIEIAERDDVEAGQERVEALDHLLAADRRDAGHGPAVECTLEGDDAVSLGRPAGPEMATGHFDRRLDRLGAGIADEYGVRERRGHQPVGELLQFGDLEQVRDVPELARLLGQCRHQPRMGVTQAGDRDAGAEIQHAPAIGGPQPSAFASREGEVVAAVDRQQRGDGREVHAFGPCAGKRRVCRKSPWRVNER